MARITYNPRLTGNQQLPSNPNVPKAGLPTGNTGIVAPKMPAPTAPKPPPMSAPKLPPPINEPMDFRRQNPTPNDRPAPAPVSPPANPIRYAPQAQPLVNPRNAPPVPKTPVPYDQRGQIPPPVERLEPTAPRPYDPSNPNPPAPLPPRIPQGPKTPIPPEDKGQIPPPTDGRPELEGDLEPYKLTQKKRNHIRRNETPEERVKRLEAKLSDPNWKGDRAKVEARLKALKENIARGGLDPDTKYKKQQREKKAPNPTGQPKVQLDDDPSTWTPEQMAELAPARNTTPTFYDNAKSSDKKPTDPKTGKPKKGDSDNDGVPDKLEVRRSETLQQRLKRLEKKNAEAPSDQLKQRIKDLKAKLKSQGYDVKEDASNTPSIAKQDKPEADAKKQTPTPKSQVEDKGNVNRDKDKAKETRQNENLKDRLARLKAKYAKNPTPQLKKRIAELEARIKVGDTKGKTNDQPGTPERPFRNRGVTYKPLSYGGQLRI